MNQHHGWVADSATATTLWHEVVPGLWQGGTADDDTTDCPVSPSEGPRLTTTHFDTVVTAYAWARPADWLVSEIRFGFYDSRISDIPMDRLRTVVAATHAAWKSGDRVLVRCQAGLNRSGLITALVLIREGYSPSDAINLIRQKRSPYALCNREFATWLMTIDTNEWTV